MLLYVNMLLSWRFLLKKKKKIFKHSLLVWRLPFQQESLFCICVTLKGMNNFMANNIYSFALHREIRAEERRAPGQKLFAERGRERIQSPPCWSLTCAQVCSCGSKHSQPSTSHCVRLDTKPLSSLWHGWKGRRKGGWMGEEQQGRQILKILFEQSQL